LRRTVEPPQTFFAIESRAMMRNCMRHTQTISPRSSATLVRWLAAGLLLVAGAAMAQKGPDWLTAVPKDSELAWYGVGEGPDAEAARRMALRSVTARLRSVISGSAENRISDVNGKVSQSASVSVSEEVLKTEFSKVDVEQTAKVGKAMAVLVRVDRPAFISDTRAALSLASKPVEEVEATLAGMSMLEQFLALRGVQEQIEKGLTLSQLLLGAGERAEGGQGVQRFGGLKQRSAQASSKLVFEVRAKPGDGDIAKVLTGFLADQGMRSSLRSTPGATVLALDSSAREAELQGDKMVRLSVRLSVSDEQGRDVASREHQVAGVSRFDLKGAREQALIKLGTVLRREGPLVALGFQR
jgi:hypothetical protein